jgi:energy-converting hydrogenase Eha subunit C
MDELTPEELDALIAFEAVSKANQTKQKKRQAGRFLMLCLFSTLLFINILLIGERVLKDTPGWRTIGLAAMLGWLISVSASLEEGDPKRAAMATLAVSLIALLLGTASMMHEARGIGEPLLLVFAVATGTVVAAARNYLDVAIATKPK